MIRHSLLVLAFAATTAAAQPLQFGPATRVAPFSAGAPGNDAVAALAPHANGFDVYWQDGPDLWSESLSGSAPRPDLATAHSLGVEVDGVADTPNGPITVTSDVAADGGLGVFVRMLNAPASTATLVAHGISNQIECNATRCLVSINYGATLAVVDTNAQLVKLITTPDGYYRSAWATDPNGFLVLLTTSTQGGRAISIDNSGNIRADVQTGRLPWAAATFNADRYAIFNYNYDETGVTALTMTPDGHLSPVKTIFPGPILVEAAAWNGSEDLLVGRTDVHLQSPETVASNSISGMRIAPDLTPIDAQPFQITPRVGANITPRVAWNGNSFYAVWTREFDPFRVKQPSLSVLGAAITATGDVVTHDLLSWGSLPQTSPCAARGTSSSMVVWSELDFQTGAALRYARDGNVVTIGTGYAIDVVPIGDDYLAVWDNAGLVNAAVLSADGTVTKVALPVVYSLDAAVAANHDRWLIAGNYLSSILTIAIARDGTAATPTVVNEVFVHGMASDGDHFLMVATHNLILDEYGKPIADMSRNHPATQVDFAGGVYGVLTGLGTLDHYGRDGTFLGSTTVDVPDGTPKLTHIGSQFVLFDSSTVAIAKADATTSIAVETHFVTDSSGRPTPALFVESVSVAGTALHRAVKH